MDGILEQIEAAHAEQPECQSMLIIGASKHYCDSDDEHEGPHHCQCGAQWGID